MVDALGRQLVGAQVFALSGVALDGAGLVEAALVGLHGVLDALVEAVASGAVVEGGVQEGVHFVAEGEALT